MIPDGHIMVILSQLEFGKTLELTCRSSVGRIRPSAALITVLRVISIHIRIAAAATTTAASNTIFRLIELQNVVIAYRNVVSCKSTTSRLLGPRLTSKDGMFCTDSNCCIIYRSS
jgi:hypothetical protein